MSDLHTRAIRYALRATPICLHVFLHMLAKPTTAPTARATHLPWSGAARHGHERATSRGRSGGSHQGARDDARELPANGPRFRPDEGTQNGGEGFRTLGGP